LFVYTICFSYVVISRS